LKTPWKSYVMPLTNPKEKKVNADQICCQNYTLTRPDCRKQIKPWLIFLVFFLLFKMCGSAACYKSVALSMIDRRKRAGIRTELCSLKWALMTPSPILLDSLRRTVTLNLMKLGLHDDSIHRCQTMYLQFIMSTLLHSGCHSNLVAIVTQQWTAWFSRSPRVSTVCGQLISCIGQYMKSYGEQWWIIWVLIIQFIQFVFPVYHVWGISKWIFVFYSKRCFLNWSKEEQTDLLTIIRFSCD
jgi:hypothetical protein